MKSKPNKKLEKYRIKTGVLRSNKSHGNNGVFLIPHKRNIELKVVVSEGLGWDHVSVSLPNMVPTWSMMCFVKDLFFDEDEVVIQYHPKKECYVNFHPYCLHLWRSQTITFPTPPACMVGPK